MKKLIILSDWAHDSLTIQEVRSAVEGFLKDPIGVNISAVASTPSTIHTAFLKDQIVRTEEKYGRPLETVIFQNTDPRIQTKEGVEEAKGSDFIVVRLKSGIYICGPNAGYNFSIIRNKIDEVYVYAGLDRGSQFRSRDLYSRVCAHLMDTMEDELDLEETHINIIPELKGHYIGHIDNFGNIKTTLTVEDLKGKVEHGDEIEVTINTVKKKVLYVNNMFGAQPGKLVIYPGSSGQKDNPYLEISVWRHFTEEDTSTGVHAFNDAKPGMEIKLHLLQ